MGYYDKKFKSRKYRLAPEDNFKLDRIREPSKDEGQHKKLNIWTVLAACVLFLIISFIIPKVASFTRERSRNDAFKWAKDAVQLIRKATMDSGSMVSENTMFVVERNNRYYLFWYTIAAPDEHSHLVEMGESDSYILPLNVKKGESVTYPFKEAPIETVGGKVKLSDKLELLNGYEIVSLSDNEEIARECRSTVHIYTLKPVN